MMKKIICILTSLLLLVFACVGCNGGGNSGSSDKGNSASESESAKPQKRYDNRLIDDFLYTDANLSAIDDNGRVFSKGDEKNGNQVGIFYHMWHGVHETPGEVLDLTKILKENPDYLKSDYLSVNSKKFHYWGEPLYGYYSSLDPWVLTRHIEIMMLMGVDFLVYDYTNSVVYDEQADLMFSILESFAEQGFNVPKVTVYTNTNSPACVLKVYRRYFQSGAPMSKYADLWYAPNGKPLIIGVKNQSAGGDQELYEYLTSEFFDFRESQWPDGKTTVTDKENGFPWMSWEYPQENYNGYMSVSLAQHPGAAMSKGSMSNYGRGYDFDLCENIPEKAATGINYEQQWRTVLENNADSSKQKVNTVMITGFNEWMAQKLDDGNDAYFVDTFSEEYSRDVEMMKGGYKDNFVVQTAINVRKFKYSEGVDYKYRKVTIDIGDETFADWDKVLHCYKDLSGDAIARNFRDCFRTTVYEDNSNRNDISEVYVASDDENLYVRVVCKDDITAYNGTDKNWMNLFLRSKNASDKTFGGFDYVVNRTPDGEITSLERSVGGYEWEKVADIKYKVSGKSISFEIPLSALNLTAEEPTVWIKATDNVTIYDDIQDYYVSGDCAPLGRFAYAY